MRYSRHEAHVEETRNASKILVGKPVGRLRLRWQENVKMDLGFCVHSNEPSCSVKRGKFVV
jgi:hypothetical protein